MKITLLSATALGGAVAALAVGLQPGLAAVKATGLPDAGFCSTDVPISGVGSTLQTNAITNVFNPNLTAQCAKASFGWLGGGSGKGINAMLQRTSLIGGTDDPLDAATQASVVAGSGTNASPVHSVPLLVAPVSVIYNLPCAGSTPLQISAVNLGKIYDGVITTWNSALLVRDNPGLRTCALPIARTARADVSGTTFLVKNYLSHQNPEYVALEQTQANQTWLGTIACRGTGTGGEIGCVQTTPNSIGYAATTAAATATGVVTAAVDNGAHSFSTPTVAGCTAAAAFAPVPGSTLANWSQATFTDAPLGYGICGFTYDLVFQNARTAYSGAFSEGQVRDAVDYLTVALQPGVQGQLPNFNYGALPLVARAVAQAGVQQVSYN